MYFTVIPPPIYQLTAKYRTTCVGVVYLRHDIPISSRFHFVRECFVRVVCAPWDSGEVATPAENIRHGGVFGKLSINVTQRERMTGGNHR